MESGLADPGGAGREGLIETRRAALRADPLVVLVDELRELAVVEPLNLIEGAHYVQQRFFHGFDYRGGPSAKIGTGLPGD